ncbi:MAG: RluA family pseudouridine synthase [Panacagrimonas sp.]
MPQANQQVRYLRAGEGEAGQRIDNFLMRTLSGVPRSHVYRLLRSGQVRINGGRVKPQRKLALGDEVRVPPVRVSGPGEKARPPDAVLNRLREAIIHEDAHYLALNKPAGIAVHAGSGLDYGVIEAVKAWNRFEFVELCHRLDRDTSGVMLLAKSRAALLRAHQALAARVADKRYFTLLCGRLKGEIRQVDGALTKTAVAGGERIMRVDDESGQDAKTEFHAHTRFAGATLCQVRIHSGRTHQIRVHAASIGHPVAGDDKYADRASVHWARSIGLRRMFLHAHLLRLPQAAQFPELVVHAPLAGELDAVLAQLAEQGAAGS